MPTNDLLPFGVAAGANVLTQANYSGLPARLAGFVAGTAESAQLNKVWRQSAFVAAMIGQFTMNNSGFDTLDNGDVNTFEAHFKLAIQFLAQLYGLRRATTGGTASAATITLTPAPTDYVGLTFLADITTTLNAGATINVNGIGTRNLVRNDATSIKATDVIAGDVVLMSYDGINVRVMTSTPRQIQSGTTNWAGTFGGTANALTCTLSPTPLALANILGSPIRGLANAVNTGGATTLTVNGMSGPIQFPDGSNPVGGEWNAGQFIEFAWDGVRFQIISAEWGKPTFTQRIPGFFHANATVGTSTTLVSGIWTKVAVNVENADSENWYDAALSRFQPTKPGYYFVSGDAGFGSGPNNPTTGLRAFKNGNVSFATTPADVPGAQFSTVSNGSLSLVAGLTFLNGIGDYLELYGYQDFVDSNGARLASHSRFSGYFVGR